MGRAGGWAIWCHRAAEAPWDYSIAARQSSFVYYYIKELRRRNDSLSLSFSLFTSTSIDLLAAKGREKKILFEKDRVATYTPPVVPPTLS